MVTHTIDQFILDPKPILLISSYWITRQYKTILQFKEFAENFFLNFEQKLYTASEVAWYGV